MIKTALSYMGIGRSEKMKLFQYYNDNVYPLIEPKRKYKMRDGDDWCAMFVSVIAHMAGIKNFPFEVSCYYQHIWGVKNGRWEKPNYTPKPNDLIYFDWGRGNRFNHVGFVVSVNNGVICTIEGNKQKTVAKRYIKADSKAIKGYIRLDVAGLTDAHSEKIADLVARVLKGEFGNGNERKRALGVHYDEVQRAVNDKLDN